MKLLSLRSQLCVDMQADKHAPIKHFKPRFPEHSDPSLEQASALNAAFVFRKGTGSSPVAPPGMTPTWLK